MLISRKKISRDFFYYSKQCKSYLYWNWLKAKTFLLVLILKAESMTSGLFEVNFFSNKQVVWLWCLVYFLGKILFTFTKKKCHIKWNIHQIFLFSVKSNVSHLQRGRCVLFQWYVPFCGLLRFGLRRKSRKNGTENWFFKCKNQNLRRRKTSNK